MNQIQVPPQPEKEIWVLEGYRTGRVEFQGTLEECYAWMEKNNWLIQKEDMKSKTIYIV